MKANVKRFLQQSGRLFSNKQTIDLLLRLLVLVILLIFTYMLINRFLPEKKNKLDVFPKRSSFHDGSSGTMALKELLESMKIPVERYMEPLIQLKENLDNQTHTYLPAAFIISEPPGAFSKQEVRYLENIAESGFHILIFSNNNALFQPFIFTGSENEEKQQALPALKSITETKWELTQDPYQIWDSVDAIQLNDKKCFVSDFKNWTSIASHEKGTFMIEKKIGKGRLVLISDSALISNYYIRDDDNAYFVYQLIHYYYSLNKSQALLIDEFHHGYHKKYTLLYFFVKKEYSWIILNILIILILLFYRNGVRFGQYQMNPEKPEKKRIFYYSEGIAGLLAKRKFVTQLGHLMYDQLSKLMELNFYKLSPEVKKQLTHLISHGNSREKMGISQMRKIVSIIKKDNKGEGK